MGIADLKRVTDLFTEGQEVVLREGADPVLLWVNKLNSFESEEARRDGVAARSRFILALREIGTPEWTNLQASVAEMGIDGVKKELVGLQRDDIFYKAIESIRNDPEWAERLAAAERTPEQMPPEEVAVVAKINEDYAAEVNKRVEEGTDQARQDLRSLSDDDVRRDYRDRWLERRALDAFRTEYQKTQLYFAVRACRATTKLPGTSAWDHAACEGHTQRALDDREEVTVLPDGLLDQLRRAVNEVSMNRSDARFLGGPASSSASSAPPSEGEASTPSTPVETSSELVTTSS